MGRHCAIVSPKRFVHCSLALLLALSVRVSASELALQEVSLDSSCRAEESAQPSLGEGYSDHAGKTIGSIRIRQVYIFDTDNPDEDNALFRLLNRLHIHTRPQVIKSQLLFEEDTVLQPRNIAESERILRSQPYLGDARILVDEDCGDEVALVVITRDVWTTEPQVDIGFEGGQTKRGFALSEGNVAGTGNALSIGYSKDEDRESWLYDFNSPHLLDSRVSLHLGLSNSSDGQGHVVALEQGFYSLSAPWAAGVHSEKTALEERIRLGGEEVSSYSHTFSFSQIYTGRAFRIKPEATQRLLLGLTQEHHVFDETERTLLGLPSNYNIVYPWVEYQYLENKFAVYTNLDQMFRIEDISVGYNWRVRLGYGTSAFGNDEDVVRLQAQYTDLLELDSKRLLRMRLNLDNRSYPQSGEASETLLGAEFGFYYLVGERHRWYAAMRLDQGVNLQQHNELTNDEVFGLRGYPIGYQRGDKRYLITLEKRYITNLHLFSLIRVGSVVFFDAGRSWGGGYGQPQHLSNVGFGLRLSSSKARVGKLLHLDVAYPLAEKDRVDPFQWVITAANRF